MEEILLQKGNEIFGNGFSISVTDLGYYIRPDSGSIFEISRDGKIFIRQNGTSKYTQKQWEAINEEIQKGISYMQDLNAGKIVLTVPEKIPPKDYKPGGIYKNIKGEYVIFLGEGTLYRENYGGRFDRWARAGAKYCWGRLNDGDLNKVLYDRDYCYLKGTFDTYAGKPKDLTELVFVLPSTVRMFCCNHFGEWNDLYYFKRDGESLSRLPDNNADLVKRNLERNGMSICSPDKDLDDLEEER